MKAFSEKSISSWTLIVSALTLLFTAVGVLLGLTQLQDIKLQTSAQLIASLEQQFADPLGTGIRQAIGDNMPIRTIHGGPYSDYQLDNYLGLFETIDDVYRQKLLTGEMLCDAFSYDIDQAWKNKEIQDYLVEIRMNESDLDIGFDDLAKSLPKYYNACK